MQYLQNRSFIASLTSTTPGYEGIIDSVEYSTHGGTQRKNEWLTVAAPSTVEFQQRFWFGYHDGAKPGYQIRTIEFGPGQAHYQTWDLSYGNATATMWVSTRMSKARYSGESGPMVKNWVFRSVRRTKV